MQIEAIELVYNGISIKKLLSHLASDSALSKARDGNFYLTRGTRLSPTLMGRVLPSPIKNRVGFGFLKKTRNGFESGLGFYKNPARTRTRPDPVKYICIVTKIPSYIYIYIYIDKTLKYLTLTISSDFSRFSFLSLQLTTLTHSPLPL